MKKDVFWYLKAAEEFFAPEHTGRPKLIWNPVGKMMSDPTVGGFQQPGPF